MKEPRLNEGLFGGQELEVVGEVVSAIVLDSSIVILAVRFPRKGRHSSIA